MRARGEMWALEIQVDRLEVGYIVVSVTKNPAVPEFAIEVNKMFPEDVKPDLVAREMYYELEKQLE